ncbi:ArdC family protein [Nitriliruptor alkaliphilus]|uniref:ArdC family protein n=1 Tax=Nitriliruptor alkaliphilus TaxID=427918 RepID=UPI000695EF14|nr:ArdC family protein [Nitriliruptor alkaliphilus]
MLEAALQRLVASGEYAEWFTKLATLHRYSAGNKMRIIAQRPDATRVASYRTWQQLDRHVIKGERGIAILHPRPFWVDPTTGEKAAPPRNDHEHDRLVKKLGYGTGYVFDVAQTEGSPLPTLDRPVPDQAPVELTTHLVGYCHDQGVSVETQALPEHLRGYYQRDGDLIVINDDVSDGERAAVLAHELSHREDPELVSAFTAGERGYYRHNRGDCEAVAEAAAHVISARFGFDITDHAAGYIAGWVDGDVDRFRQLHGRVDQVTCQLVPPDHLDLQLTAAASRAADLAASRGPRRR